MASSMNPRLVLLVPDELIKLSKKHPELLCNLRPEQRSQRLGVTEKERRLQDIKDTLASSWYFYRPLEPFLKSVRPGERLVLACQGFGEQVFTFVTDVAGIYWAQDYYPRVDLQRRPRVVRRLFGESNLWGSFILAFARVPRKVKIQAGEGYDLLLEIAKMKGNLASIDISASVAEELVKRQFPNAYVDDDGEWVYIRPGTQEKRPCSECNIERTTTSTLGAIGSGGTASAAWLKAFEAIQTS
jgi:hypothetical protein